MDGVKVFLIGIFVLLIGCATSYGVGRYTQKGIDEAHFKEELQNDYITKQAATLETVRVTQEAVNEVSARFTKEKESAASTAAATIDSLTADNKRLLIKLKQQPKSGETKGDNIIGADGRAEIDTGAAERIVSITTKGDAWIKALQDTVRELQGRCNE